MKILIVKLSSLGDVIQSLGVLEELVRMEPTVEIDWAVEKRWDSLMAAHPSIRMPIAIPFQELKRNGYRLSAWKALWRALMRLRRTRYDWVFDLQGNSKSGLVTWLSRGTHKVGFGWRSLREWPNWLATNRRFEIPAEINMRLQYLHLIKQAFRVDSTANWDPQRTVYLRMTAEETTQMEHYLSRTAKGMRIMVCPGSKWINKQLSYRSWLLFLQELERRLSASFIIVAGEGLECMVAESLVRDLSCAWLLRTPSLPLWQNLMCRVNLLLAVDSSALHLAGTTHTPSFSFFGPTMSELFRPLGAQHGSYQGRCPYGRQFSKQCPILRSCATGACLREPAVQELIDSFFAWWHQQS